MLVSRFLRAGSVRARAPAAAWMSSGPSVIPAGAPGSVQLSASARAGLGVPAVAALEAADASLRRAYDAPVRAGGAAAGEAAAAARRRAAFRSRQRGWLEVDLLLGGWASPARLAALTDAQLAAYERILALETADLFPLLQGQPLTSPAGIAAVAALRADAAAGPLLAEILAHVLANPVASPAAYAARKAAMSN
jgi:succinate dehydrogenase flavin-adding protein (antitoxin of CptAB toxin-antitoxin module)